jgi:hypothetical protein
MRPATGMCHVLPPPLGSVDWHMVGRRLASALSWRCLPAGYHQLQHPPPTVDPAVPSSQSNVPEVQVPPPRGRTVLSSICMRKKYIGRAEREILVPVLHGNYFFKSPLYRMIPRIEVSALLAPYRARPGTATGFPAPTTGRCGDADGSASAPPSGAAAAAPPAGA